MSEFTGQQIRSAQFPQEKRRGYQSMAVDLFLEDVGQYVDTLRGELEQRQQTERSAMLLLQTAQQTADQTVAAATAFADQERTSALSQAEEAMTRARAEAKLRMESAEAQIEQALADASVRLNELEREIQSRRRELALLEAGASRFALEQAARMREQADVLLGAATAITAAGSSDVVDALVVGSGPGTTATEEEIDLSGTVEGLVSS